MSIFTFIADLTGIRKELHRLADAADRAYPLPDATPLPADDKDVSYATDEDTARRALLEEAARHGFRFDDEGNLIEAPADATEEEDVQPESH